MTILHKARALSTVFLAAMVFPAFGQSPYEAIEDMDVQSFVEEVFATLDTDASLEDLYETFLTLYNHPIALHRADEESLRALMVLSEKQINNFRAHVREHGPLVSVYELQAIDGFDLATIRKIRPFVAMGYSGEGRTQPLWRRITQAKNNYFVLRYGTTLETKRGFRPSSPDTGFDGPAGNLFARFRASHPGDFSFGFTLQHDAGEPLAWSPGRHQLGADFHTCHAQLKNLGWAQNLVVGDYQLQFGQGLLLGAGLGIGKGAEAVTTARRAHWGIRPYTSSVETGYLRGGAVAVRVSRQITATPFVSIARRDATLRQDTLGGFFSALPSSGLHRTPTERGARKQARETVGGGNVAYANRAKTLRLGATYLWQRYSLPYNRPPNGYNQFVFRGQANHNLGIHYSYQWQNINFFGEAAQSRSGGWGILSGLVASLAGPLDFALLYRRYSRDFHNFFGGAFGENSTNSNETGIYWGAKLAPSRRFQINAYYDMFQFPWLRFGASAPSGGYECLARASYRPSKRIMAFAQFREEAKPVSEGGGALAPLVPRRRRGYIFHLDYPAGKSISLKTRIQIGSHRFGGRQTWGHALVQDISLVVGRVKASARMAIFDAEDFQNRQFVYERDVPFAFSIPAYSGVGTRHYWMVQYRATKKLAIWLRYARTRYTDRNMVGSGQDQIDGNTKTDIRLQARVAF